MSKLSNILRSYGSDGAMFWCPGCEDIHAVRINGTGAWGYNGNPDKPTFTPSVLVTYGHVDTRRCHSFVTDGRIQFLSDCTHALAGQTVDLPPFPYERFGDE